MNEFNGTRVYFVRHGQTVFNKEKRLQGWKDSPLSDEGVAHSIGMGEALQGESFSQVWVSPLGRAVQTAEIMRKSMGFDYETCDELREVSFGEFEGFTLPQIEEHFPGMWEARQNDKWSFRPPGGESNLDGVERALRVKKRIEQSQPGSRILVVAHFAINRLVISQLMGITADETMRMNVPHGIIYRMILEEYIHEKNTWRLEWQMADQLHRGFNDGWLAQTQSENQLIPKY